jgi:hypothetical protein
VLEVKENEGAFDFWALVLSVLGREVASLAGDCGCGRCRKTRDGGRGVTTAFCEMRW